MQQERRIECVCVCVFTCAGIYVHTFINIYIYGSSLGRERGMDTSA